MILIHATATYFPSPSFTGAWYIHELINTNLAESKLIRLENRPALSWLPRGLCVILRYRARFPMRIKNRRLNSNDLGSRGSRECRPELKFTTRDFTAICRNAWETRYCNYEREYARSGNNKLSLFRQFNFAPDLFSFNLERTHFRP